LRPFYYSIVIALVSRSTGLLATYYFPTKAYITKDPEISETMGFFFNTRGLPLAAVGSLVSKKFVNFFGQKSRYTFLLLQLLFFNFIWSDSGLFFLWHSLLGHF
jgi:hypothetical protein